MIRRYPGKPDSIQIAGYSRYTYEVHLYDVARVESAMHTPGFTAKRERKEPVTVDLIDAIREASRSAHRWRDRAASRWESGQGSSEQAEVVPGGRCLILPRYTQPEPEAKLVLEKLLPRAAKPAAPAHYLSSSRPNPRLLIPLCGGDLFLPLPHFSTTYTPRNCSTAKVRITPLKSSRK
jgi:hypothetical protein